MRWGFFCATCKTSSPRWYETFDLLLADYGAVGLDPDEKIAEQDTSWETLPTVDLRVVNWIVPHVEHELWAECDVGILLLNRRASGGRVKSYWRRPSGIGHGGAQA